VMVLNRQEAVDNPHVHQETPSQPMLDSPAPIINTFTRTKAILSWSGDVYMTSTISVRDWN